MCVFTTTCWLVELHACSQSLTNINILKWGMISWTVELSNEWRALWNKSKKMIHHASRFVAGPEEDGKICKQQTKKTDETHLRSWVWDVLRHHLPSQITTPATWCGNEHLIYLIITQDSLDKKRTHLFHRVTPTAYRRRLWSPFKDCERIAKVSGCFRQPLLLVLLQSPWPRLTDCSGLQQTRENAVWFRSIPRQLFSECQESVKQPTGNWVLKSSEDSPSTFSVRRDACLVVWCILSSCMVSYEMLTIISSCF